VALLMGIITVLKNFTEESVVLQDLLEYS